MSPVPDDTSNAWYDSLLHFRDSLPNAGIIACNLLYGGLPLRVQCAGGTFEDGKIDHLNGPVTDSDSEGVSQKVLSQVREVKWVTFGGVLIRREVLDACGSFDARYRWAYVMDVDYCFEARKRGFRLFQVPVFLQHEGSRTTAAITHENPGLLSLAKQNFDLFYEKWAQVRS